jgi:hypothetical protein
MELEWSLEGNDESVMGRGQWPGCEESWWQGNGGYWLVVTLKTEATVGPGRAGWNEEAGSRFPPDTVCRASHANQLQSC